MVFTTSSGQLTRINLKSQKSMQHSSKISRRRQDPNYKYLSNEETQSTKRSFTRTDDTLLGFLLNCANYALHKVAKDNSVNKESPVRMFQSVVFMDDFLKSVRPFQEEV